MAQRGSDRIGRVYVEVTVVPANEADCADLQALFGNRWPGVPAPVPAVQAGAARVLRLGARPRYARDRLRRQTDCGHPEADADQWAGRLSRRRSPSAGARSSRGPAYDGLVRCVQGSVGRSRREAGRRRRLGSDLPVHPGRISDDVASAAKLALAAVDFARTKGRPGAGGIPDDHHRPPSRKSSTSAPSTHLRRCRPA